MNQSNGLEEANFEEHIDYLEKPNQAEENVNTFSVLH